VYKDITGIILCGGKSSRMGTNKAFLKLGNKYIIEILSDLLKSIFSKVILVTNDPGLYEFLNIDMYEDIYKSKGPLGGIHSGLIHSHTEKNFVISCDIPLITKQVIEFIVNYRSDKKIRVPYADGYVQQLCGVYSRNLLNDIVYILNRRTFSPAKCNVLKLVEETKGEIINIEKEMPGYAANTFLNLNDLTHYSIANKMYGLRTEICRKNSLSE
jgi:molybdopterin-guanine dinucleotide biosynthesis protein A